MLQRCAEPTDTITAHARGDVHTCNMMDHQLTLLPDVRSNVLKLAPECQLAPRMC